MAMVEMKGFIWKKQTIIVKYCIFRIKHSAPNKHRFQIKAGSAKPNFIQDILYKPPVKNLFQTPFPKEKHVHVIQRQQKLLKKHSNATQKKGLRTVSLYNTCLQLAI